MVRVFEFFCSGGEREESGVKRARQTKSRARVRDTCAVFRVFREKSFARCDESSALVKKDRRRYRTDGTRRRVACGRTVAERAGSADGDALLDLRGEGL